MRPAPRGNLIAALADAEPGGQHLARDRGGDLAAVAGRVDDHHRYGQLRVGGGREGCEPGVELLRWLLVGLRGSGIALDEPYLINADVEVE
jgi:hypothetical protein